MYNGAILATEPIQIPAMKIFLLQARKPDDPVRKEELQAFAEKADLALADFTAHDLLASPPELRQILDHDAMMVGGSGDFSVSERNLPFMDETLDVFRELAHTGHPVLASCFGFHLLTQALGGEIVYQPESMEVGTYDLELTEAGKHDALFRILPPVFPAQLGHKDAAAQLPPGVTNLACSQQTRYQAFRLTGQPVWATQFHPEMTGEENRFRYQRYLRMYSDVLDTAELQEVDKRFRPSPEAQTLIPAFLKLIGS